MGQGMRACPCAATCVRVPRVHCAIPPLEAMEWGLGLGGGRRGQTIAAHPAPSATATPRRCLHSTGPWLCICTVNPWDTEHRGRAHQCPGPATRQSESTILHCIGVRVMGWGPLGGDGGAMGVLWIGGRWGGDGVAHGVEMGGVLANAIPLLSTYMWVRCRTVCLVVEQRCRVVGEEGCLCCLLPRTLFSKSNQRGIDGFLLTHFTFCRGGCNRLVSMSFRFGRGACSEVSPEGTSSTCGTQTHY